MKETSIGSRIYRTEYNNSPIRHSSWMSGQPNDQCTSGCCVYINTNGNWIDDSCTVLHVYTLCEIKITNDTSTTLMRKTGDKTSNAESVIMTLKMKEFEESSNIYRNKMELRIDFLERHLNSTNLDSQDSIRSELYQRYNNIETSVSSNSDIESRLKLMAEKMNFQETFIYISSSILLVLFFISIIFSLFKCKYSGRGTTEVSKVPGVELQLISCED